MGGQYDSVRPLRITHLPRHHKLRIGAGSYLGSHQAPLLRLPAPLPVLQRCAFLRVVETSFSDNTVTPCF